MERVTRRLADLVAIPSVNPMGRPLSGPEFGEARVGRYLEACFRDLGVRWERQAVSPGRDNLLAWYDPPGSRQLVLFDVHQDTVPTDGMTIPPFEPLVVDDRLFGRGACDIKGGMAAMLVAFERLVRERPAGSASVLLACTVDEEFTHTGSSRLAETPTGAELAIVAEPTRLDLVNTHKGAVRWKVRTEGVACHSSTPTRGDNAIYHMARVVGALESYAAGLAASTPDPVLGRPSLSVGRIEGGQSVNVVPDWCEAEIDRRIIPGESPESAIAHVAAFLRERLGDRDLFVFLSPWVRMPALEPRPESGDPWLPRLSDAIRRVRGTSPRILGVPFGTDAGPLGAAGLPSYVFGPGDIAQAHTKDEWVDLDQVQAAAEIYFEMARALG